VAGLAEHVAVHDDDRVASDDDGVRLGDRPRLAARQALGVRARYLARQVGLVDVGRPHFVRDVDQCQQVPATRRLRREDDTRAFAHRSSQSVTGPSFTSSTSIIAPNSPVSVGTPRARIFATNSSYSGMACSGRAASMKLGRRPFSALPYSVNCETTSTDPPTSATA